MTYIDPAGLPSMESLVAAVVAGRTCSFSAAALELQTTHAAISRRVAAAEAWAGTALFERHARGMRPTAAGQRVLARLAEALDRLQQAGAGRAPRSALPVVRIAATPSLARFWLLPQLQRLQGPQGRPRDLRVDVVAGLAHADLAGGEVDLALRCGRGGWGVGDEMPLLEEALVPAFVPGLWTRRRGAPTAREILALPLLHDSDTTHWRAWAEAHGQALVPKADDRTPGDYALSIDAALAGLGVVLWNPGLHAAPAGLTVLPALAAAAPLRYFLLTRHGDRQSPAATVAGRIRRLAAETVAASLQR